MLSKSKVFLEITKHEIFIVVSVETAIMMKSVSQTNLATQNSSNLINSDID